MTHPTLEIETPADDPVVLARRFVTAPPAVGLRAWTEPDIVRTWIGPRYLEVVSVGTDARVGGTYRHVHRAPDGVEHAFHGEQLGVDAPVLEAVDGGTLMQVSSRHSSTESRGGHVVATMASGMPGGVERLGSPARRDAVRLSRPFSRADGAATRRRGGRRGNAGETPGKRRVH